MSIIACSRYSSLDLHCSCPSAIPGDVAKDMKLEIGDVLEWEINAAEKGKKYVKVRKLE